MDEKTTEKNNINDQEADPLNSLETYSEMDQNIAMARSHLRRTLEKQSKKTLVLTGIGLLVLIILLVLYGQTILVNFSVLLGRAENETTQNKNKNDENIVYIAPPFLDPQPDATNSANIKITGNVTSDGKMQIRLYVNNELADVTDPESDGTFTFEDITLKEGSNKIKAVAVVQRKTSDSSETITISYLKNPPSLSIEYPQDNTSYAGDNSTLTVKGKTDQGNSVTVNDYIAITKNDGSFTYNFKMQNGENKIKATATDPAGNKTEKEIIVTYSP